VSGEEVIWLRGFAAPAALQPRPDATGAILLRAVELGDEQEG
jgi:hypothetical protein